MYDVLNIYRVRRGSLSRDKLGLVKYNVQVYIDVLGMNKMEAWVKFILCFIPALLCKRIRKKIVTSSL